MLTPNEKKRIEAEYASLPPKEKEGYARLYDALYNYPDMTDKQQDEEVLMGMKWREEWRGQAVSRISIHKECASNLPAKLVDETLQRLIAADKIRTIEADRFIRVVDAEEQEDEPIVLVRLITPSFAERSEMVRKAIVRREDVPGDTFSATAIIKECSPDLTAQEVIEALAFFRKHGFILRIGKRKYYRSLYF